MDISDFFEFQGAFKSRFVIITSANEEGVASLINPFGNLMNFFFADNDVFNRINEILNMKILITRDLITIAKLFFL